MRGGSGDQGNNKGNMQMNFNQVNELQSSLQRRWGDENGISIEVGEYLTSRKKVKKAMHKALKNLKGMENKCFFPLNKDPEAISMVSMLREVEMLTLTVLEYLLSSIFGSTVPSKPSNWSLVPKLMQQKHVACEEAAADPSEFEKVDAALNTLIGHKSKSVNLVHVYMKNELGELESCIQALEEGLEFLFRHLIKTRVSLLNILNH